MQHNIKDLTCDPLKYVLENSLVSLNGIWAEFGVFTGKTINYISKFTENKVYGFDTFEGLPDQWDVSNDCIIEKGYYSFEDYSKKNNIYKKLPIVNENVLLIKGEFKNTLKDHLKLPISFMHVDCDTYSSTVDIFRDTTENIMNGCVLVFDEFINYPNYHKHEYKAFMEWVDTNSITYEFIGTNGDFDPNPNKIHPASNQKVAIKILKNPKYKYD